MAETIFPVKGIPCAWVVVNDHRASMAAFARFFGIADWRVQRFDSASAGWIGAHGSNGRVAFELVEPTGGASPFEEHRRTRGEGMFALEPAPVNAAEMESALALAARSGIATLQQCRQHGVDCVWLDTRAELGAVTVLRSGDLPGDTVDLSHEVAKGQPLPVQKHYHFGIVTPNRDAMKAAYERLYGMDQWIEFKIETGVTMSDTTYYGRPVEHAYDNWVGRRDGFAVELIQMRYGDAVYQEMREHVGDGLHHVFPTLCSPAEFAAAKARFAADDMPIIQSGRIAGMIDYFYVDGRRTLAGVTIEVVTPLSEDWIETMLPGAAAFVLVGPPAG